MPSSDVPGLSAAEVAASRAEHGANRITPPPRTPWWRLYLRKFDDPIIRILSLAALVSLAVGAIEGNLLEALGILLAIFLATALSFFNEYRAGREFDLLSQVDDEALVVVRREGAIVELPRHELVVGDVVLVERGAGIPADAEVLAALSLRVDEARLTGESIPVSKMPAETAATATLEDITFPRNHVFRGTLVVDGRATLRLRAVGDGTYIAGILQSSTAPTQREDSPLTAQLERLSRLIGVVGLAVAALIYFALVLQGALSGALPLAGGQWWTIAALSTAAFVALAPVWRPMLPFGTKRFAQPRWPIAISSALAFAAALLLLARLSGALPADLAHWLPAEAGVELLHYFMIAVTIIVVAVPEGLAMSVTLSLAHSMRRLMAARSLVRRMNATEAVGAATVICTDKTGTLTQNTMSVHEVDFAAVDRASPGAPASAEAALIAEAIATNSTANLGRDEAGATTIIGNRTEGALLRWLHEERGQDYAVTRAATPIIGQVPFSTERKFMATRLENAHIHVKGAPELALAACADLPEVQRSAIKHQLADYQRRGMRTLAFIWLPGKGRRSAETDSADDATWEALRQGEIPTGFHWLGLVAISDPLRHDVQDAIAECQQAGVEIKIVTGDTALTAQEIARQCGLWSEENPDGAAPLHLDGPTFAAMDDAEIIPQLSRLRILSRARPHDKTRLVNLLRAQGEIVTVTGDGVNDAPALNAAHVGLAMGSGDQIAKEASDIILLNDAFSSIVRTVRWGRALYANIQRFLLFQLTINFTALGVALLGPFLGVPFPLTIPQMLWVNLIMDTLAALALATDPPQPSDMRRPPRDPAAFILTRPIARQILAVGAAFIVALAALLLHFDAQFYDGGAQQRYAESAFFTAFVFLQLWNLLNARASGSGRSIWQGWRVNPSFSFILAIILLGQVILVSWGGDLFRTTPLRAEDWLLIALATSPVFWLGELARVFSQRRTPTST
ncbi:MAG: cation-translocating P-type ATPase [Chloroflexi bacterium]|nr:cation-translocating P-type ATPase [Chloroflexota bacterium]